VGGVSAFATILFERRDDVAWVTLNRPEVLNAYDTRMRDDLYAAFGTVRDDASIRAVVLRGAGRAFCAGGDIHEFGSAPSPVAAREVRWRRDVWGLLRSLPQPTIAAVHGHAAGSGCEMALLCDFRIASRDALFSLPETALGMIPGVIGTQTAPRIVGVGRALDLMLTGRTIDARLAERLGIVGSIVSRRRLDAEAHRLAQRLTRIDGELSAALKRLVWRALDRGTDDALRQERILASRIGRKGRAK